MVFIELGRPVVHGKLFLLTSLYLGGTTRNSAAASKFTALTYISGPKQEKDWIGS